MTRTDWDAMMLRYIHRTDLSEDLDRTFEMARSLVTEAWRFDIVPWTNDAELLDEAGRQMVHAGLAVLHELVQDDIGLQRETQLFVQTMADLHRRFSISRGKAIARSPYVI